ncbi:MAG: GNAT family N-acetyltransferase [Pseudomonadota bacterium]
MRGEGLGRRLFDWAMGACRDRGCSLVQLTSDRSRSDAHRFCDMLGFEPSHVGFKLQLQGLDANGAVGRLPV